MENKQLDTLINGLSNSQKTYLLERLRAMFRVNKLTAVENCPCCNAHNFIKHGSYNDTQKYLCKQSKRVFTFKTKTVVSGIIEMDKFSCLLDMMSSSKLPTLTEIQQHLRISRQTAFDWRTKIITALYAEINFDNNILEFDETNLRLSKKARHGLDKKYSRKRGKKLVGDNNYNVKVFMAYSRTTKKLELFSSHMGRTKNEDVANYLGVKKDPVIYSDKHQAYVKYYKDRKIVNGVFKSSEHISRTDKVVHNQTINYFGGLTKKILNDDLRGVSTKYLQGYLNWIMFVQNEVKQSTKPNEVIVMNKVALDVFKQKEREFQYFLKNNGRTNYGTYKDRYYKLAA